MRYSEFKLNEGIFEPAVKQIQQFLISKGYDLGAKQDDGIMGPKTREAIQLYLSKEPPEPSNTVPTQTATVPTSSANISEPPTSSGDIIPTKGPITGPYGRTVTGPKGNKIPHPGVDIGAPAGTPVVAPEDGTIKYAGWGNTAGNLVELVTADGTKHRFMHLSKITTTTGATVKKGQQIGNVGNTGFSKGAHLHWEKYASGKQVNPIAE